MERGAKAARLIMILSLLEFAIPTTCLSIFLDWCMGNRGRILHPYKKVITFYLLYQIRRHKSLYLRKRNNKLSNWKTGLYKVGGGCIYCTNFWITAGAFIIFLGSPEMKGIAALNPLQKLLALFLLAGINHCLLRIWNKVI